MQHLAIALPLRLVFSGRWLLAKIGSDPTGADLCLVAFAPP